MSHRLNLMSHGSVLKTQIILSHILILMSHKSSNDSKYSVEWQETWNRPNHMTSCRGSFDPADLALTVHVLVSPSLHHHVLSGDAQRGAYLTGDSLFSSFLPFDRRLFFFLFARSCEPWGSSGIWGTLDGLRGLIVPGRRGRVIGEGARTGTSVPSTLSLVSVDTCREK